MNKFFRHLVAFICALSLSLSSVVTAAAQSQQRFALAGTMWEIAYEDAQLGEVKGLAKFGDGQDVSGIYQDPRNGKEYPFKGVARLEMIDGKAIATISILQKGPLVGPSPGDLTTEPGGRITAKLGKSKASLTILEASPVTLELELYEKTAAFGGLWKSADELAKPMRAGTQSLSENGKRYAAGPEVWLPSTARFVGEAELRDANRNVFDGKKAKEQKFVIKLRGIGLPDYELVKKRTVDFKDFADTLSLDFVWPNDGFFGRSLEMRVKAKEIPGPGTYPLTVNGINGTWTLKYADLLPKVRLVRQLRVDEFETVSQVYIGEDVFIEVEFEEKDRVDALDFATYETTLIDSADTRHDVTVRKAGRGLYRSGPLACLAEDEGADRKGARKVICLDEAQLSAIVKGARGYQHDVTQPVVKAPSPLWDEAMEKAEACRTASFDQNVKGVNVQKNVHAALILLRDEMKRSIAGTVETYNTLIGPDPDLRMDKLASDLEVYKASIKSGENDGALIQQVSLPNASKSEDKISLRDALNGNYEPPLSDAARVDYELVAASEAQGMMLSAAERTKKRLDGVGDCDLEALLQFGKLGAGAFNEKLKKKLLRKGLPGEAAWMPDLAARASVDAVAGVVGAVQAEDAYRQAKIDFALTMVSLATAGVAITATVSTKLAAAGTRVAGRAIGKQYSKTTLARLAAAGELAELAELGSAFTKVVDAQTRGQDAVDRARDLAPVIGGDAFEQAQAEKDAQIKGAAIAAAVSGASAVGAGVLGRIGKKTKTPNKRVPLAEAAGLPPKPPAGGVSAAADAVPSPSTTRPRPAGDSPATPAPRPSEALPDAPPTRTAAADEPAGTGLARGVDTAPPSSASRPRDPDATVKVEPDKTVSIPRNMRGEGVNTGAQRTADATPPPARPRDPDATVKVEPDKTVAIPRNMRGEGVSTGAPRTADAAPSRSPSRPRDPDATVKVGPDKPVSKPRAAQPEVPAKTVRSRPADDVPGKSADNAPIAKMDAGDPPTVKAGAADEAAPPANASTARAADAGPPPPPDPSDIARAPRAAEPNSPGADPPTQKASASTGDGGTEIVRPGQQRARGRPDAARNSVKAGDDDYTLGERIGEGGSADVYRNASDPSNETALRVIHDERPSAIASERAGRQNLEGLAKQNNGELFDVVEQVQPPRLIDESSAPMLLNGRQVEVVKRIDDIASDVIKKNKPPYTGRMTPGQARAHKAATDYMNDNGVAWIDNSPDNYGLVEVPPGSDKWKMRIVDTGGVVKFKGPDAAAKARALQSDIANPPDEFLQFVAEARANGENRIVGAARLQRLTDLASEYNEFVDFSGTGATSIGDIGGKPAMSINFPTIRETARPGTTPFEFRGEGLNMTPTGTVRAGRRPPSDPPPSGGGSTGGANTPTPPPVDPPMPGSASSAGAAGLPPTQVTPPRKFGELTSPPRDKTQVLPRNEGGAPSRSRPPPDPPSGGDAPMVDELTPEELGLERVESPQEVIERLRTNPNRTEAEDVELFEARTQQRRIRDDVRRMDIDEGLAARQTEAGNFNVSEAQMRPNNGQGHPESAGFPIRRVVPGDGRYVRNIMARSGYKRSQPDIVSAGINDAVDQMLSGGPFPPGRNGKPIRIRTSDNTIQDGHHRLIAAHIVSKLTGRPLFSGPNPIIPPAWIELVPTGPSEPVTWTSAGIQ